MNFWYTANMKKAAITIIVLAVVTIIISFGYMRYYCEGIFGYTHHLMSNIYTGEELEERKCELVRW